MSTTSRVAILRKDGRVSSVYCHDGDIFAVAPVLFLFYKNAEKVNSLINLGDLSKIGKLVEVNDPQNAPYNPDLTLSYHRDRGERKVIRNYFSYEDFLNDLRHRQDYNFIFNEKKSMWYYIDYKNNNKQRNLKFIVKEIHEHLSVDNKEEYKKYLEELKIIKNMNNLDKKLNDLQSDEGLNIKRKKKI